MGDETMVYEFKEIKVEMPKHDADVIIVFPGGKTLQIQARPSNADRTKEGHLYNGSLDIVLPHNTCVANWIGDDMEEAPEMWPGKGRDHERAAKQLVIELPGDYHAD